MPGGRREKTRRLLHEVAHAKTEETANRLRQRVVVLNIPVADEVASRYRDRGIPLDDLHQVAYEGLIKSVARFKPDEGHDLLSYAVPTMRGGYVGTSVTMGGPSALRDVYKNFKPVSSKRGQRSSRSSVVSRRTKS